MMLTARELIMEIGIFAVAARSAADMPGSGGGGVDGDYTVSRGGVCELSSGRARAGVDREGSADGLTVTGAWNVAPWVKQLIGGLWQCN